MTSVFQVDDGERMSLNLSVQIQKISLNRVPTTSRCVMTIACIKSGIYRREYPDCGNVNCVYTSWSLADKNCSNW